MADWTWADDEPTDEELDEIAWAEAVYPEGFCRSCGAPLNDDGEFSECPNCGSREWA